MLLAGALASATAGTHRMERYNVVWASASRDATGVMPLGNGDIAAGVYAIEGGDLYLLLAKNDAYNSAGDIYRTGRVRVSLAPNPFKPGKPFRQTLDLPTGSVRIEADGVMLSIWADASRPVCHVEISAPQEIAVTAQPEFWERLDGTRDVRLERQGRLLWYFPVGDRSVYPDDLKFYQVEQMATKFPDPYRFNTFGNLLESTELSLKDGVLAGRGKTFDIRIHACAMQTPEAATWIETIERQAARPVDAKKDWEEHCRWWANFWERSWIVASDNTLPAEDRERLNGEASPSGVREESDGAALGRINWEIAEAERSLAAVQASLKALREQTVTANDVGEALRSIDPAWDELFPAEQARVVKLLVERVIVHPNGLDVRIRTGGLQSLVSELQGVVDDAKTAPTSSRQGLYVLDVPEGGSAERGGHRDGEPSIVRDGSSILIHIPMRFQKRSGRREIIVPCALDGTASKAPTDGKVIVALARARRWQELMESGEHASISDLADDIGLDRCYLRRLMILNSLAPDIVESLLGGDGADGLSLDQLTADPPVLWRDQRGRFGHDSGAGQPNM